MNNMVVLGGGRWARVLMSVLADVLPADWRVVWVTQHGHQAAMQWSHEQQQQQACAVARGADWIELAKHVSDARLSQMQAAIVATAPDTHGDWLQRLLRAQVPTLCEKPLVLDAQQAVELERRAVAANCPLGVNLELHYATYIEQFAGLVSELEAQRASEPATGSSNAYANQSSVADGCSSGGRRARHFELQWADPWSEVRYGETKYSDVYTNIVDDMFPHCWSLLRHVTGEEDWCVDQVQYLLNSEVQISLVQGYTSANITLSRRASRRTRCLSMRLADEPAHSQRVEASQSAPGTDGVAFTAELDFSLEPGCIRWAGQRRELEWDGERPLTRSLKSFLSVINAHRTGQTQQWQSWPLSIVSCRQSVQVSTAIAAQLRLSQQGWLDRCSASADVGDEPSAGGHADAFRQRLWLDVFLPEAAAAGERVEFTDPQRLQAFYDRIAQRNRPNS